MCNGDREGGGHSCRSIDRRGIGSASQVVQARDGHEIAARGKGPFMKLPAKPRSFFQYAVASLRSADRQMVPLARLKEAHPTSR